jgi:hypothetical protein
MLVPRDDRQHEVGTTCLAVFLQHLRGNLFYKFQLLRYGRRHDSQDGSCEKPKRKALASKESRA